MPDLALDRADSAKLVVLAEAPNDASGTHISSDKTVADANPDYPADDTVQVVAYQSTLEEHFGLSWCDWPQSYLTLKAGEAGLRTYHFPSQRLEADDRAVRPDEQEQPAE